MPTIAQVKYCLHLCDVGNDKRSLKSGNLNGHTESMDIAQMIRRKSNNSRKVTSKTDVKYYAIFDIRGLEKTGKTTTITGKGKSKPEAQ